ncbi:MAG: methyltransferase domain-containing protein [Flavobacteriales bacterium]|nr:methyltransferase domain-containing protein [Flavobacteriales bacterium]
MDYIGDELELFRHATNWKRYWSSVVARYVNGQVLDVGSGLGVNAPYLVNEHVTAYTFLEPDARLLSETSMDLIPEGIQQHRIQGTTADMAGKQFDTLAYIDVLEHLLDPAAELQRAMDLLRPAGHIVIVVPAFQFLYSPFDKAIGHFRRYDRAGLRADLPAGSELVLMRYLDSMGLLLSLGNKLLLRRAAPDPGQIAFWDKRIIPISRITDRLVVGSFGRSLIAVLRKA